MAQNNSICIKSAAAKAINSYIASKGSLGSGEVRDLSPDASGREQSQEASANWRRP